MFEKGALKPSIDSQASIYGVLALLIFIILTTLFFFLGNQTVYEPKPFLAVINILFLSVFPFAAAYISSSSYLRSGLLQLLILGGAMITFGICNFIAAWGILSLSTPEWTNFLVAIHNSGGLVFAVITFAASIIVSVRTSWFEPSIKKRKLNLSAAYFGAVMLAIFLAALILSNDIPSFVVSGNFTLLRQSVLFVSIVLLSLSSVLLGKKYFGSKSYILYWYSLGLALIAIGFLGILIEPLLGTPLSWTGRAAQYVGCVFFVVAVLNKTSKSAEENWAEAFSPNRSQLTNLFSKMLDGFAYQRIITDASGKPVDYIFLEVNAAFEKATGLKKENIVGKKVTEVLPGIESDPAGWIDVYGRVALMGESVQFENYAQSLNKWFRVSAYSPQKGYFVTLFEDITDRKKTEKEIRNLNSRFEMAQHAARVGVWNWDIKTGQIEWTTEMFNLFGLDPKTTAASFDTWNLVLHPEDKNIARIKIEEALKTHSFLNNEYRIVRPSGKVVWINALGQGEYGKQNEPIRMTGICINISERKRVEEELRQAQIKLKEYTKNLENLVEERTKQLKDSERLATIGATAGMVGHDIRNPLQAISGDVFLLKEELKAIPELKEKSSVEESLEGIEKNIDYINKIVADLQDFARPLKPNLEETDLKLVIDNLLKKNGLPENVEVTVKVEDNARKVIADCTFINRIMYNLVNNAVQAMPKGGKLIIHAYKEANDILITVKDTGIGIPEAIKDKMFTPMFTTKSKGQGFGLAVIKRMTESLGGTVTFESQEGKGTTFTIRLPPTKN